MISCLLPLILIYANLSGPKILKNRIFFWAQECITIICNKCSSKKNILCELSWGFSFFVIYIYGYRIRSWNPVALVLPCSCQVDGCSGEEAEGGKVKVRLN